MMIDTKDPPRIRPGIAAERDAKPEKVPLLLVGGSRLLQEGVVQLLADSRFTVKTCVESVDRAIQHLTDEADAYEMLVIQLMDASDTQFFKDLLQLKKLAGSRRIVLLAWPTKSLSFLANSRETGVDGFLESNMSQEIFRQSLDVIMNGEKVFPSRMGAVSSDGSVVPKAPDEDGKVTSGEELPVTTLSGRELEILRHLASGRPNKVIANDLKITEATVKVHVKGVLRKISAANRTQAAIWAIHHGLKPIFGQGDTNLQ